MSNYQCKFAESASSTKKKKIKISGLVFNALISAEYLPSLHRHMAGKQKTRALAFVHNQAGQAI